MGPMATLALLVSLTACGVGRSVVGGPPSDGSVEIGLGVVTEEDVVLVFHPPDAIPIRNADVSCGGTAASLTRRRVTAILVIDRSGSMADRGSDGTPKWEALLRSLRAVLPRVDRDVSLGLILFPQAPPGDAGASGGSSTCEVSTALAVEPAPASAANVLATLDATGPRGNTPTYAGLRVAEHWFNTVPDLEGERYVILATDGAPNCNPTLLPGCRCTGAPSGCGDPMRFSSNSCLDDRAVGMIEVLRGQGVGTYVLGLDGVQAFTDVLDAMAAAGGHARATAPRYYSAVTAEELTREFESVTSSLLECRFVLDSAPPDPRLVDVRLDGASLLYDVRHADGWDWADGDHREIRFYGRTCELVREATGGTRVVAAFGCPAPVPP